ncbi:hypothetical protein CsSME_00001306 [Camellia sinensis var. sinensis]
MEKKRKHSEAEVAVTVKKDESAEERPKRTLLGLEIKRKFWSLVLAALITANIKTFIYGWQSVPMVHQ